ncbi:hypothetical protein B1B05_00685 [Domibacillus enclensis]|uniref:PTS system, glucose-like IIB component n=1 Tax=Domibacillus enclensis TaxID=1017273 RepID=A0A1N6NG11_9BACI|nr:hypothetical protein B1B05_00685 [Domibacillus enclensis]SIP90937.1 PTS system, glucose-like IIB component [Domibacillus enclensis]
MGVVQYVLFRFLIVKFDLKTPGREEETLNSNVSAAPSGNEFEQMAAIIYDGLGGDQNVTSVDNCVTRLRMEVKDMDAVDQAKIKSTGVPGINIVGPNSIQVIVGTKVQFVADEIKRMRKNQ